MTLVQVSVVNTSFTLQDRSVCLPGTTAVYIQGKIHAGTSPERQLLASQMDSDRCNIYLHLRHILRLTRWIYTSSKCGEDNDCLQTVFTRCLNVTLLSINVNCLTSH